MNVLVITAIVVLLAGQAALAWALARSLRRPPVVPALPEPGASPAPDRPRKGVTRADFDRYALQVETLALKVDQLPRIWTEEADRAFRSAERAEKAGKRSRKKPADEVDESDPRQLEILDGGGGPEGGVPALRGQVASSPVDEAEAFLARVRRDLALAAVGSGARH